MLLVHALVAVERSVGHHEVEYRHVAVAVGGPELLGAVLEYRNDHLELVYKHADIVLLDVATDSDGDTCDTGRLIFLHDGLHFGHVLLAVRALGAEVVDHQRSLGKVAKQNSRVAYAGEREAKVHLDCGPCGILHEGDVRHLRFRCKLGQRHGGG